MTTTLTLELVPAAYSRFLTEFRKADREQNAGHETQVTYADSGGGVHIYYFRSKNFTLFAYDHNGAKIMLTDYNHVSNPGTAARDCLIDALKLGGDGGTRMNRELTRVVALTSEAARSKLVERVMKEVLRNDSKSADLNKLEIVFKAYNHVAKRFGRFDVNGNYTPNWRPLEKDDYLIYFRGLGPNTVGAKYASIVNEL
ncbi:hypothetical protein AB3X96_05225 [Paraburkholderia sp. BR13439]|uniref:hypothetical protein n=1 Tax=Paraburkholderia sp. BR13439 TaxID=3236996 RepID=UPI0034CFC610